MEPFKAKEDFGKKIFQSRDYTPIPLILILFFIKHPSIFGAVLGTLLIVFGELFRIYSVAFIGSVSRTRKGTLGGELVRKGPFNWVRNPLYCGNFFIVFGFSLFSGSGWFVFLTLLLFSLQYHFVVQFEESILEAKFGDQYRKYMDEVPAWLPKSLPRLSEIEWPHTFSDALQSEKRTLTAIVVILAVLTIF